MSAEENKATMRRWFEEGINKRKLDLLDQYFSADFKYHGPGGVELSVSLRQACVTCRERD